MNGFSGAQDMGNFRDKINNIKRHTRFNESDFNYLGMINQHYFQYQREKSDQELNISLSYSLSRDPITDEIEKFISVAIYSKYDGEGLKENPRPNIHLCIVLDISGSMNACLKGQKSKLEISKFSLIKMLNQMRSEDFLSITLFDDQSYELQEMRQFSEINYQQLIKQIEQIKTQGGTNFQAGFIGALKEFEEFNNQLDDQELEKSKKEYENRIFIFTDAQPNLGETGPDSLLGMMTSGSERKIYTTFFGVGLDFNSDLVDKITKTYGANYYKISKPEEFDNLVDHEFDYMVFTSTFDLCLNTDAQILSVYGSPDTAQDSQSSLVQIRSSSPSYADSRGTKGGIILLKIDPSTSKAIFNLTYRTRSGEICKLEQSVQFQESSQTSLEEIYSSNTARKAIFLVREVRSLQLLSVNLGKQEELKKFEKKSKTKCFEDLIKYLQQQIIILKDEDLQKEIKLLTIVQMAYQQFHLNNNK